MRHPPSPVAPFGAAPLGDAAGAARRVWKIIGRDARRRHIGSILANRLCFPRRNAGDLMA